MATEEKKEMGRPTKLTSALKKRALEYLLNDGFKQAGDIVPSVAGLACYLGVSRSTVYEYVTKNLDFSDIVEGVQAVQERMLINGGLNSDFNASITKLMMAKHGYSDKQEITGKDGEPIQQEVKITDKEMIKDAITELEGEY